MESVQTYNERGWNYIAELRKYVAGGMTGNAFIDGVSGIVNRGCHDPVSKPLESSMTLFCLQACSLILLSFFAAVWYWGG